MSFAEQPKQSGRPTFSLAPMLDVLFLVLIFFVTTSSFQQAERQVDVELPIAETAEAQGAQRPPLVVNVPKEGRIRIGDTSYSMDQLRSTLGELVEEFPEERLIIRGDQQAAHGRIIEIMDAARAAGVRHIYFATVKPADQVTGG